MSSTPRTLEGLHQDIQDNPFMYLTDEDRNTLQEALRGDYDLNKLQEIFQNNLNKIQENYSNLTDKVPTRNERIPEIEQEKARRQLLRFYQQQWNNLMDNIKNINERRDYMLAMQSQAHPNTTAENAFYGNKGWKKGDFSHNDYQQFIKNPPEKTMLKSGEMGISGSLANGGELAVAVEHKAGATREDITNDNIAAIRTLTAAGCNKINLQNANVKSAEELKKLISEVYSSCDNPKKITLDDTPCPGGKYWLKQSEIDELYESRHALRAARTGTNFDSEMFEDERNTFETHFHMGAETESTLNERERAGTGTGAEGRVATVPARPCATEVRPLPNNPIPQQPQLRA